MAVAPQEALALAFRLTYTTTSEEAMAVTLNLNPKIEADLLERARASGMPLEEYLLSLVEGVTRSMPSDTAAAGHAARAEAVRRMVEFGEKHHLNLGEPITRKLLHEGHRF
jgi:hypothetical protein